MNEEKKARRKKTAYSPVAYGIGRLLHKEKDRIKKKEGKCKERNKDEKEERNELRK